MIKRKVLTACMLSLFCFGSSQSFAQEQTGSGADIQPPDVEKSISEGNYFSELEKLEKELTVLKKHIQLMESQKDYASLKAEIEDIERKAVMSRIQLMNQMSAKKKAEKEEADKKAEKEKASNQSMTALAPPSSANKKMNPDDLENINEDIFQELYLMSIYGNDSQKMADVFFQGGMIRVKEGEYLPGDWRVEDILKSQLIVSNADVKKDNVRSISLKDPETINRERELRLDLKIENEREEAELDRELRLERQKAINEIEVERMRNQYQLQLQKERSGSANSGAKLRGMGY